MTRSTRDSAHALASLAHEQGGYFTAKQANEAGYGYRHLDYHETAGNFERVGHGLYRIPTIPLDPHDDLIRLSLWSRDQKDEPQAVVSHQSALILHDLSELIPSEIHLTVPPKFRKVTPTGCILHKAELSANDIVEWTGFRATTPIRTLLDVAGGDIDTEQLAIAIDEALTRGLVRRKALDAAMKQSPHRSRLEAVLADKSRHRSH